MNVDACLFKYLLQVWCLLLHDVSKASMILLCLSDSAKNNYSRR